MKRFLITFIAAFSINAIFAQASFNWDPKYFGEIHLGYNTSASYKGYKTYQGAASIGTIQGIKVNQYLSAGIGVDGRMMTHYYKGDGLRWQAAIYANFRGYYPLTQDLQPFLNFSIGAGKWIKPEDDVELYVELGPGIQYKNWNLNFGWLSFGPSDYAKDFFYVKAGFSF